MAKNEPLTNIHCSQQQRHYQQGANPTYVSVSLPSHTTVGRQVDTNCSNRSQATNGGSAHNNYNKQQTKILH